MKSLPIFIFFILMQTSVLAVEVKSGPDQIPLIELYSSEGCSSCPPADRWFSGLKKNKGLWQDFIPVAFHVDYWDWIGWKDRFASEAYSARQRRYAAHWSASTVYTPGLVYNGEEWRGWRSASNIPKLPSTPVGFLYINGKQTEFNIKFESINKDDDERVLHIAVLGTGIESDVKSGENRGRNLKHDFIVLDYQKSVYKSNNGIYLGNFHLKPIDVVTEKKAVAAWVTRRNNPTPIQAAGGYL